MKVICSTVVRAAKQGDIHGGLYVIDIDSEEVLHYAPYEKDFINDNERGGERGLRGIAVLSDRIIVADSAGFIELDKNTYEIKRTFQNSDYFKSIHEIVFHDDHIWATSTAHDAVAKVDLEFNIKGFWEILGENAYNCKRLTGKKEITPENKTGDDNYHINSLFVSNGNLRVSGLLTPLYNFDDMVEVCAVPTISMLDGNPGGNEHSFLHNFYEYEDCSLINMTSLKHIGIIKDGKETFVPVPATNLAHFSVDKIAENNWNRGLTKHDNLAIIGSSPARLMVLDINTGQFIHHVQLEKDVRHAIHGLEILEV